MASKLQDLINRLCPNGVEYRRLGDCVRKVSSIKWAKSPGRYRYIDLTSVSRDSHQIDECVAIDAANAPSRAQQIVEAGDVLFGTTRPMLKRYCIIDDAYEGEICSTGFCVLRANVEVVLHRWLFHVISMAEFYDHVERFQKGASYPAISDAEVKAFLIPVPPLEVQSEIVQILDNFAELTAELTAELEKRKKQYEHYRDLLLRPNKEAQWLTVGEVCDVVTDFTAAGSFADIAKNVVYKKEPDFAQLVRTTDIKSHFSKKEQVYINESAFKYLWRVRLDEDSIILPNIGNCGEVYYLRPDDLPYRNCALAPNALLLRSGKANLRYLSYWFMSEDFQRRLRKIVSPTGQTKFNKTDLKKLPIPLPPLAEQRRIVSILDRFDRLCNDLTSGLPAEIAARKKQYAYYRDKLLAFPRAS